MGAAASSVVDGPRAPHIFHLLLFGFVCHPCLLGYLHNHRCVPIHVPLSLLVQPARPDSSGRVLDPAVFHFADERTATEMYDIPITLVNHAFYDRG